MRWLALAACLLIVFPDATRSPDQPDAQSPPPGDRPIRVRIAADGMEANLTQKSAARLPQRWGER